MWNVDCPDTKKLDMHNTDALTEMETKPREDWSDEEFARVINAVCDSGPDGGPCHGVSVTLGILVTYKPGTTTGDAENIWEEFRIKKLDNVLKEYDPGKIGKTQNWIAT